MTVLERVDDPLWIAEGEVVDFYGFPYPTRSVIARLSDGTLWVWSPVRLTEALQAEISALGEVAHLVSPNKLHHLYLGAWKAVFPRAALWGLASLQRKRKDLAFGDPLTDTPPSSWRGEIDQAWFRGSPFMDEVVFFHKASKTAIIGDLSENFSAAFLHEYWGGWRTVIARLWRCVEGYGYAPLEWRLSWIDRKSARAALDKVVAWRPKRVIMAHGQWQKKDGEAYLRQAFSWLRR
ncbi:DUF4336 domain-containing protein [Varunaivibrio sulfuroxidans]|nr:DUF4336 domain-containing protein [Varunaivibrio sulfuroxidans]WES31357.1 DUF4336 domain-containing protein [Varunaivibrio sulfuroxidans]